MLEHFIPQLLTAHQRRGSIHAPQGAPHAQHSAVSLSVRAPPGQHSPRPRKLRLISRCDSSANALGVECPEGIAAQAFDAWLKAVAWARMRFAAFSSAAALCRNFFRGRQDADVEAISACQAGLRSARLASLMIVFACVAVLTSTLSFSLAFSVPSSEVSGPNYKKNTVFASLSTSASPPITVPSSAFMSQAPKIFLLGNDPRRHFTATPDSNFTSLYGSPHPSAPSEPPTSPPSFPHVKPAMCARLNCTSQYPVLSVSIVALAALAVLFLRWALECPAIRCSMTSPRPSSSCRKSKHGSKLILLKIFQRHALSCAALSLSVLASHTCVLGYGGHHSCVISSGGALMCWGWNSNGQIGIGTSSNVPTPTALSSLSSGVVSVHTGLRHTCAIVADAAAAAENKLYCWGWNADGQLGLGSTQDQRTPTLVNVIAPVWAALGRQHSCAVVKTGALLCWGYNAYGQLGTGNTVQYVTPTPVVGLSSGVVTVAVGEHHSCAIMIGNVLKCWGWNSFGQLGIGSTVNQLTAATVPLSAEVDAVHAGAAFSCAVVSGGSLICWGSSVGLGVQSSAANQLSPGAAVFGNGQTVGLASAGLYFACATVVGGSLMCWGDFMGVGSPSTLPTNVVGFDAGEVTALGLGHGHACAVAGGGTVKCWGGGGYGQLGIGSYSDRSQPATVSSLRALAIASGGILNAVSSLSFAIAPIDRVAGKSAVSITLGFKPSVPIPPGSAVALMYPPGFFAPAITPTVAWGASTIPEISISCGPTTATRITIVTSGAAIAASFFTVTLSGLTMGPTTDGGPVTVQTSGANSAPVLSGPIAGVAAASVTISHALPNALQGACASPSLPPPPPPTFPSHLQPL